MRIATLLASGILLVFFSASAADTSRCTMLKDYFETEESTDPKINAALAELLAPTGFEQHSFTICSSAEIDVAQTFVFPFKQPVRLIVFPTYVLRLSETAIRGVLSHEMGHVRLRIDGVTSSTELDVDKRAVEWVGYEVMITAHREILTTYKDLYPNKVGSARYRAMQDRLDALIELKKRRDSS